MFFARRLFDEKLVFRRAPGVWARIDDQLSVASYDAFTAAYGMLDKLGNAEIVPQLGDLEFFRNGKNCSVLANKRLRVFFPRMHGRACMRRVRRSPMQGPCLEQASYSPL